MKISMKAKINKFDGQTNIAKNFIIKKRIGINLKSSEQNFT